MPDESIAAGKSGILDEGIAAGENIIPDEGIACKRGIGSVLADNPRGDNIPGCIGQEIRYKDADAGT